MGLLDFLTGGPKKDPAHITDANFEDEVAAFKGPVVIDFWGPSCSWCAKMVPTIRILAAKYDGRVKIGELDVSASPGVASQFGVKGTPTLLFIRNGRVAERLVGFQTQMYIEEVIAAHFADAVAGDALPEKK